MTKQQRVFIATVYDYYEQAGRHDLPWRQTTNPYHIMVSEIMLQQTQVDRVIPKYLAFIARYPTPQALAAASLKDVLTMWQGLGYNRRAKSLWLAAQYITDTLEGVFPGTYDTLQELPGVGPYTAGAILAFAYNQPVPIIETNIRTVFLYHFFPTQTEVTEEELLAHINATLDTTAPRRWYAALMDYGTYLKREQGNQNTRAKNYRPQSTFRGSNREVRGAIIRYLATAPEPVTLGNMQSALSQFASPKLEEQLTALVHEGLVVKVKRRYTIPT